MTSFIIPTYVTYLAVTIALTVFVAHTLFKNGRIFLIDIFHNNTELADSVNKLLVVGFYLVIVGYAVLALTTEDEIQSSREMIEYLSTKIGIIILILGALHFGNLYVFFELRKRAVSAGKGRRSRERALRKPATPPEVDSSV